MRAAILVPAPDYPEDWDWAYEVEAAVLLRAGFSVEARPWTEAGELTGFDLVMPLVAWGYHQDPPRWHALLDRLQDSAATVLNPVPLLRWNSDKRYLAELGGKGIATIATRLAAALDEADLDEARAEFGDELVIKPPVSASAHGTHRLRRGDPLPEDARGREMLVQPFLRSVAEEGEYSIMLFGGQSAIRSSSGPRRAITASNPTLAGRKQPAPRPTGPSTWPVRPFPPRRPRPPMQGSTWCATMAAGWRSSSWN